MLNQLYPYQQHVLIYLLDFASAILRLHLAEKYPEWKEQRTEFVAWRMGGKQENSEAAGARFVVVRPKASTPQLSSSRALVGRSASLERRLR